MYAVKHSSIKVQRVRLKSADAYMLLHSTEGESKFIIRGLIRPGRTYIYKFQTDADRAWRAARLSTGSYGKERVKAYEFKVLCYGNDTALST